MDLDKLIITDKCKITNEGLSIKENLHLDEFGSSKLCPNQTESVKIEKSEAITESDEMYDVNVKDWSIKNEFIIKEKDLESNKIRSSKPCHNQTESVKIEKSEALNESDEMYDVNVDDWSIIKNEFIIKEEDLESNEIRSSKPCHNQTESVKIEKSEAITESDEMYDVNVEDWSIKNEFIIKEEDLESNESRQMSSRESKILKLVQMQEQHKQLSANDTQIVPSESVSEDKENNTISFANNLFPETFKNGDTEPLNDDFRQNTPPAFSLNCPTLETNKQNNINEVCQVASWYSTTEYPLVKKSNESDIDDTFTIKLASNYSTTEDSSAKETNEPNDTNEPSTSRARSFFSLPSTSKISNEYIIQNRSSTKINLRKIKKNDSESFPEQQDFSSGSSDNYNPNSSGESNSLSRSSESEPEVENSVMTDENSPIKGKKRVRNKTNWKNVQSKRFKNLGQEYTSRTGKIVKSKSMKDPCLDKCIQSCSKKISGEFRQQVFKEYWKLGSLQRQRDFLGSCIEQLSLKCRRLSSATPRNPNCAFYLLKNGKKIRICKTFLINTLGISEKTLRTVVRSKVSGKGEIAEDRRGKHDKHKKTDEDIVNSVREHINSIPRIESHHVRSETSREFIDGGLSIAELHRNYCEERKALNKAGANYDFYAKIFNMEFNIGFFNPKKDQCDLCESYENASQNEKENLENMYQEHLNEKILSREEKEEDKKRAKRGEITLAVYDLQALLPVPLGQTSAFFYKSRLNCYNFTITEVANDTTKSFFWHEGLGNRGAIEIGTCVLMYLEEISKVRPGVDVVFFSDNCGGKQKNRFLIALYLYAVERFRINSITHKYLIRGHTLNEGDTIHSIIERSLKRSKKSGPIYVPDQYVSIIRNSKKKGNPIEVKEMGFEDFYDVKTLFDEMGLSLNKNTDGKEFKICDVKIMQFEKGNEVFRYKTSYKQNEWTCLNFKPQKRRSDLKDHKNVKIKQAYSKRFQLSENKIKDLKSLIDTNIIPSFYKYFFDSVFS